MSETVAIIATCDTKGEEALYLKQRIESYKVKGLVIDSGIVGKPVFVEPDITRDEVVEYSGLTIKELIDTGSRGAAVAKMRDCIHAYLKMLYREHKIQGLIGIGGAEGSVIARAAMDALPLGVPKIAVSTIATGKKSLSGQGIHTVAAGAVGMEGQHLITPFFELGLDDTHDRLGGGAQHADTDTFSILAGYVRYDVNHSHDGTHRIVENPAADGVDAQDIDNGMHDRRIIVADEIAEQMLAGSNGGYGYFGHPQRQGIHCSSRNDGAFSPADADEPLDFILLIKHFQIGMNAIPHFLNCSPSRTGIDKFLNAQTGIRHHLIPGNIRFHEYRFPKDTGVDHQPLDIIRFNALLQVQRFFTFGITGCDDGNGLRHGNFLFAQAN